jgi:hypothetical protein
VARGARNGNSATAQIGDDIPRVPVVNADHVVAFFRARRSDWAYHPRIGCSGEGKMRAVWIALCLSTASGAFAQDAEFPFDIPKQHPAAFKAWHAIVPKRYQSEQWIYNFDCTASPNHRVTISGKAYLLATCCKPHDCGDNGVARRPGR